MWLICKSGLLAVVAILTSLSLTTGTALAHERRDVGKHQFVVGWIVEPAFEGIKNGLDLRVTNKETSKPVEGLQDSLQWEITHVPSGVTRTLKLRTIFNDPGHYTADLIPTASGVYRFRIFGAVEGAQVNEIFVSRGGGGGFGDIEPVADLQFPTKPAEVREVEAAVRGAQNAAQQAQDSAVTAKDSAASATTLAAVGIVLGALGTATAAGSVMALRRRRGA